MSKQLSKNILQPPYNFNEVWEELLESKDFVKVFLSEVLEAYILKQRWYGGKASKLKYIELSEYFKIKQGDEVYYGLILEMKVQNHSRVKTSQFSHGHFFSNFKKW